MDTRRTNKDRRALEYIATTMVVRINEAEEGDSEAPLGAVVIF